MVTIKRNILNQRASNVPGRSMKPKYITVHNTANTSRGADAEMHMRYQHNGSGGRQVSWHYTVDDKEVWQTLEDNQQGWHAGDGSGSGNTESIGVEICENSDGDFQKAVSNAQKLIKQLMDKHDIPLSNVVTHKHWSGKNCPRLLLNTWSSFKDGITGKASAPSEPKSSGSKSSTSKNNNKQSQGANLTVDGKWGNATTEALQQALGTVEDGIISNQRRNAVTEAKYGNTVRFSSSGNSMVIRALQKVVGATEDGLNGPQTVRQLQRYLGTVQDGVLSRPSMVVEEMQRRLNAGTFV